MSTFSTTAKVFASLAAAAALTFSASPSMASCEMPAKHACPPPAPACAAPQKCYSWFDVLLYYVPNRVLDFIDIGRLSIGIGCGFGVNVRVTELAEIGFGQYSTTRFGMKGRVLPVYEESINESGIAFLGYVNGC